MLKVIGVKESKGIFEKDGKTFKVDNVIIYAVSDDDVSVYGVYPVAPIKIKREAYWQSLKDFKPQDLVGCNIVMEGLQNQYGKINYTGIRIIN